MKSNLVGHQIKKLVEEMVSCHYLLMISQKKDSEKWERLHSKKSNTSAVYCAHYEHFCFPFFAKKGRGVEAHRNSQ